MKKLITRVALAAATATMTASALVAVAGPASAAALPTAQHGGHHPGTAVVAVAERGGLFHIGQGWSLSDGHREWHGERDGSGHSYWRSGDNGHQLRYDGHRVYHWTDGRWATVTQANEHAYDFDRWHFDQLWTIRAIEDPRGI
ncbi:hypothetical protein [Streptomyces sp. NPDC059909]|uniref:hypothetical protein n=1 Tax=Streptomyces sp. NPDC059909 TaxID=3346998 RepID=UPI00364B39B1